MNFFKSRLIIYFSKLNNIDLKLKLGLSCCILSLTSLFLYFIYSKNISQINNLKDKNSLIEQEIDKKNKVLQDLLKKIIISKDLNNELQNKIDAKSQKSTQNIINKNDILKKILDLISKNNLNLDVINFNESNEILEKIFLEISIYGDFFSVKSFLISLENLQNSNLKIFIKKFDIYDINVVDNKVENLVNFNAEIEFLSI